MGCSSHAINDRAFCKAWIIWPHDRRLSPSPAGRSRAIGLDDPLILNPLARRLGPRGEIFCRPLKHARAPSIVPWTDDRRNGKANLPQRLEGVGGTQDSCSIVTATSPFAEARNPLCFIWHLSPPTHGQRLRSHFATADVVRREDRCQLEPRPKRRPMTMKAKIMPASPKPRTYRTWCPVTPPLALFVDTVTGCAWAPGLGSRGRFSPLGPLGMKAIPSSRT